MDYSNASTETFQNMGDIMRTLRARPRLCYWRRLRGALAPFEAMGAPEYEVFENWSSSNQPDRGTLTSCISQSDKCQHIEQSLVLAHRRSQCDLHMRMLTAQFFH